LQVDGNTRRWGQFLARCEVNTSRWCPQRQRSWRSGKVYHLKRRWRRRYAMGKHAAGRMGAWCVPAGKSQKGSGADQAPGGCGNRLACAEGAGRKSLAL